MTAPTAQTVASVNWPSFGGLYVCVVDQTSGDVALGVLDSLRYNVTNGVYWVGVGSTEQRLISTDMVTVVQVTSANRNNPTVLGLNAQIGAVLGL